MSPRFTDPVTDEERTELFAIYLNLHGLHGHSFDECLALPLVLACLRNTLVATKRAIAERRQRSVQSADAFELQP